MKTNNIQYKTLTITILAILSFSSCTVPIKKLYKKTQKLNGKTVRVKGEVISSIELSDIKCFTVKDKTGKIFISTDNLLPIKRDYIRVVGVLENNFLYKKRQIIAIKEKQMKLKKLKVSSKRELRKGSNTNDKRGFWFF